MKLNLNFGGNFIAIDLNSDNYSLKKLLNEYSKQ
ncbi:hypothetical protein EV142_10426 [Flavobacterium circumlabens]|uniref:Uncharacterized protein n=1 Tax=Flavobacterium circumlabens TaxID=2133765 RepID=A0ABY2AY66_9FLAO|nr:hypothetical protein EV142_10426 [Flavobacterium circumlabens]